MDQRTPRRRLPSLLLVAVLVTACAGGSIAPTSAPSTSAPTASVPIATPAPTASPSSAPTDPPIATTSPTQELIDFLLDLVERDPGDGEAQRDLGLALLQRVRETGDPSLYPPAEAALLAARALVPEDALVLAGIGALQLGRHEFAEALATGRAALTEFPGDTPARGIEVDALIELGQYDEAFQQAEVLAAQRPDIATLSRLSYTLELRGDLDAALTTMEAAAASPGIAAENTAYVLALVGHLRRLTGDVDGAAAAYAQARTLVRDHAPSLAGQGRLAVGAADLETARARFERAAAVVPLPEYVIALGETLDAMGEATRAKQQFDLARALIALSKANGVVVDVDLALFEADHGDPGVALGLAEIAYAATPTVRAADARAWALHRLGRDREAATLSAEALRLGSRDPLLQFHAGAIAAALGRVAEARGHLEAALAGDPGFSPAGAAEARRLLDQLGG